MSLAAAKGYGIGNVDVTIICEAPKIGPHRDAMRESIAALLGVHPSCVNVKATTTEQMGFTGRREGLAWVEGLVRRTAERPARLGCFGLHEWAMVYGLEQDEVRHESWPLRLQPDQIRDVVDENGLPIELGSGRFAKAYLGEERWVESKTTLRRPVAIKWKAVTSESRIPAVVSGQVDLECGSTTNNLARQQQVAREAHRRHGAAAPDAVEEAPRRAREGRGLLVSGARCARQYGSSRRLST